MSTGADHTSKERLARRLRGLPRTWLYGRDVRIAEGPIARLAGLALLSRERSGGGLLLERCRAVHTFGMRFPIDVRFLDADRRELRRVILTPGRAAVEPGASAVLELPAAEADLAA